MKILGLILDCVEIRLAFRLLMYCKYLPKISPNLAIVQTDFIVLNTSEKDFNMFSESDRTNPPKGLNFAFRRKLLVDVHHSVRIQVPAVALHGWRP